MHTTQTSREIETAVNAYAEEIGLSYTAAFVPTKQPAHTVPSPQLNWNITLSCGSRSMTVTYHQGCAHVVGYQQHHKTPYDKRLHMDAVRQICETGRTFSYVPGSYAPYRYLPTPQPFPTLTEVLYALISDYAVLDTGSFEEWARDLGYDTDSRSAEQIYHACLREALQLHALLGETQINQFRTLLEDY